MSGHAIEVRGLGLELGGNRILDDVSFDVKRGEFFAVIGPNGAGKSSLLKCLNRIFALGSGQVALCGKALGEYRQRDLARVVGYVPQADARYFPFSVREFVLMGRYPHLSPFTSAGREDVEAAAEAMEAAGCSEFAERSLDTLSGGERQKVFIAAALAQGAEILLLDEPTTFLDYRHQVEVSELLSDLHRERGTTIVMVTHDVSQAVAVSERVLALKGGRRCFFGAASELAGEGVLEELFDIPFERVEHAGRSWFVPRRHE